MNRPTLVSLPQELLDNIVELAWPELPRPRTVAPCRRLQSSFDRLRYASIHVRGCYGPAMYHALQFRYAIYPHLIIAPLERLEVVGDSAALRIYNIIVGPNAKEPKFLASLRHLALPFNPWMAADPSVYKRARVLDHFKNLESLSLDSNSWCRFHPDGRPALEGHAIPPLDLFGRLTEFKAVISAESDVFKGLVRQMPCLECLRLKYIPSPGFLNNVLDALAHPDLLTTLEVSFDSKCLPTDSATVGAGFVNDGGYAGIRVVLAPFIRRLPGLKTLVIGNHCTCFDSSSEAVLKARAPLRQLQFIGEVCFDPSDIEAALDSLGGHTPREVRCDHYEEGRVGTFLRDLSPVHPSDDFPSWDSVHRGWSEPEWFWSNGDQTEEEICALIEYGKKAGVKITGGMVDGLEVRAKWKEEEALYDVLLEAHEAAMEAYVSEGETESEASGQEEQREDEESG